MAIDRAGRSRRRTAAALLSVILASAGCGENELPAGHSRRAVALQEIPETVSKAARKALPGVMIEEAWANVDGDKKLHSYEIRGRSSNGKIREVRVSPTGAILEME